MSGIRECLLLVVALAQVAAYAEECKAMPAADSRPRVCVRAFAAAASLVLPENRQSDADMRSVALGKSYLVGRLARRERPFDIVDDGTPATHDLIPEISFLRSRENTFKGDTYGVETKTTKWMLDVILTLKCRATGEIAWAKVVTGSCEEQRPISATQFDNNIFHTLMVSAVEEAADALLDHFTPRSGAASRTASAGVAGEGGSGGANRTAPIASARPSLAILRPDFRDGVTANEAAMLWGYMESCVDGAAYRVVSRADVARMMEEVAITTSSYLTDPTCREKARVGKLATVSKLLAARVGRVGEKYVMTFTVFDASTGEIDASRTDNATSDAIEELLPVIRVKMERVLAPAPSGTVLAPVALRFGNPPNYLAGAFTAHLETALAEAGIAYTTRAEGARRLMPSVTAFSVRAVAADDGFAYRGTIAFSLALTDSVGKHLAAPVVVSLDDVELGRETGAAPPWMAEQHGRKLLDLAFSRLTESASFQSIKNMDRQ